MVDLLEYEGKKLFKEHKIAVPAGQLIKSSSDIRKINEYHILKAQVPAGHRGLKGGVVKVKNKNELESAIKKMSSIDFNGFKPTSFLYETLVRHKKEIYVGLTLDRSDKTPVFIVSPFGGVDIENVPINSIKKFRLDILLGVTDYTKRAAFDFIRLAERYRLGFYAVLEAMWDIFTETDCELVEINPLAVTDNDFVALDSKISIEDDALFRHLEYKKNYYSADKLEMKAKGKDIAFVRLDGDIGLIANGAGLTLATIDQIKLAGGSAGDFLDLGGTDDPARVEEAIELVKESNPKVLLINIFGGVTKADTVAKGIINAITRLNIKFGIVVRLKGFNEDRGRRLLKDKGIDSFIDMDEAVKRAVELSKLYGNTY